MRAEILIIFVQSVCVLANVPGIIDGHLVSAAAAGFCFGLLIVTALAMTWH